MMAVKESNFSIDKLRILYKRSSVARGFLDIAARRQKNSTVTTIESAQKSLSDEGIEASRKELIGFFKELEDIQCGRFIAGRRGSPSRFKWAFGLVSIGQAVSGELQQINEETTGFNSEGASEILRHSFHLRPNLNVDFTLPVDLNVNEASRLADYIKTLPFRD